MNIKHSGNIVLNIDREEFLIDIRYMPSKQKKPIILFIHGFKGFKDWGAFDLMADYFAEAGFMFVKMNFSHNGTTIDHPLDFADLEAFGNNNFSIEQDNIQTALDELLEGRLVVGSEADFSEVYLIGHSRGGAAAILTTSADDRIKKLATLAGVNDLANYFSKEILTSWEKDGVFYIHNSRTNQEMPMYYQIVEDYKINETKLDVRQAVKEIDKPFLALHGTADETLPVSMLHEIKSWNKIVEIIEIDGANHTFGSTHPYSENQLPKDLKTAVDHIIKFFKQ